MTDIENQIKWILKSTEYKPEDNCISLEENKIFVEKLYPYYDKNYLDNYLLQKDLNDVLLTINEREKNVLEMLFGLNGKQENTMKEVGYIYNVSRERIRQIEAKAIRKLRHPSRAKKLKIYL